MARSHVCDAFLNIYFHQMITVQIKLFVDLASVDEFLDLTVPYSYENRCSSDVWLLK